MSGVAQSDVVISFTTSTGTAGATDFTAQSGESYTILAGETSVTIPVEILGDDIAEATESFTGTITITNANGQQITIDDGEATGTIADDDAYTLSIADELSITETDAAFDHNFTVSMSGVAQSDVVISFTTSTGTAGATDFTAQSGESYTILAGETSVTIPVEILGDDIAEATESFTGTITITNANGQQITIDDGEATGTIADDDAYTLSIADELSITETDAAFDHNFTVSMSGVAQSDVVISFTTSTGTAGATDFTAQSGESYTILAGETSVTIPVEILGDDIAEATESFTGTITITNANGQQITIDDGEATGTIADDDSASLSFLSIDNVGANEADGTMIFTISLDGEVQNAFSIDYESVDGTATVEDSDYNSVNGTLSFVSGDTEKTITVTIVDDSKTEADETIIINLTNLQDNGQNIIVESASGTGTIYNDDHSPVVSDIEKSGSEDFNVNFTISDFTSAFTDEDGDTLTTVKIVSLPGNGDLYLNSTLVTEGQEISKSDLNNLEFRPKANWYGDTEFDYNAFDGTNWAEDSAIVYITISSVNDKPVAEDDQFTIHEDEVAEGNVIENDKDIDGGTLQVTQITIEGQTYSAGTILQLKMLESSVLMPMETLPLILYKILMVKYHRLPIK